MFVFIQDQYVFIHDAILESVTCGDTQINAGDLRKQIQKMSRVALRKITSEFQYQFKILEQVTPNPDEVNCSTALKHMGLNRGTQYLPSKPVYFYLFRSILNDPLPNTQMKTRECFSKDKNLVMTTSMLCLLM